MAEAGLSPGPLAAPVPPDEWMKRLGGLPLVYQPGEKWMYHTGADVLGVLMARATGHPLEEVLATRLFGPLGMTDTGFHVPAGKLDRLPAAYGPDPDTGSLVLFDHSPRVRVGPAARVPLGRRRAGVDRRRPARVLHDDAEQGPARD